MRRLGPPGDRFRAIILDIRALLSWPSMAEATTLLTQLAALCALSTQIVLVLSDEQWMVYGMLDWQVLRTACCMTFDEALELIECPPPDNPCYDQVIGTARALIATLAGP